MSEISLEKKVKFMNMQKEFCGKYAIAKCNGCPLYDVCVIEQLIYTVMEYEEWNMKKGGR